MGERDSIQRAIRLCKVFSSKYTGCLWHSGVRAPKSSCVAVEYRLLSKLAHPSFTSRCPQSCFCWHKPYSSSQLLRVSSSFLVFWRKVCSPLSVELVEFTHPWPYSMEHRPLQFSSVDRCDLRLFLLFPVPSQYSGFSLIPLTKLNLKGTAKVIPRLALASSQYVLCLAASLPFNRCLPTSWRELQAAESGSSTNGRRHKCAVFIASPQDRPATPPATPVGSQKIQQQCASVGCQGVCVDTWWVGQLRGIAGTYLLSEGVAVRRFYKLGSANNGCPLPA